MPGKRLSLTLRRMERHDPANRPQSQARKAEPEKLAQLVHDEARSSDTLIRALLQRTSVRKNRSSYLGPWALLNWFEGKKTTHWDSINDQQAENFVVEVSGPAPCRGPSK